MPWDGVWVDSFKRDYNSKLLLHRIVLSDECKGLSNAAKSLFRPE